MIQIVSYTFILHIEPRQWTPEVKCIFKIKDINKDVIQSTGKSKYYYNRYTILTEGGNVYNMGEGYINKIIVNDNEIPRFEKITYKAKNNLLHKIISLSTSEYTVKYSIYGRDYNIIINTKLYEGMNK